MSLLPVIAGQGGRGRPKAARSAGSFLCCVTSGSQLCLPLDSVVRAFAYATLQPIPRGPSFLKGVLNLSGMSLPVIDLAERVGLPPVGRYGIDTCIVLCEGKYGLVGVIVESIIGLASAPAGDAQLEGMLEGADNCLAGIAVVNGRQSLIVDMHRLLDLHSVMGEEA